MANTRPSSKDTDSIRPSSKDTGNIRHKAMANTLLKDTDSIRPKDTGNTRRKACHSNSHSRCSSSSSRNRLLSKHPTSRNPAKKNCPQR